LTLVGPQGAKGDKGDTGEAGPQGSVGQTGPAGANGLDGAVGPAGANGANGLNGADGAVGPQGPTGANGATGATGNTGPQGPQGATGANGLSAYGVWLISNSGTEQDFLNSLKGAPGTAGTVGATGATGDSAYQVWLQNGHYGATEADFLNSLVGAKGDKGDAGAPGLQGVQGIQGIQGPQGIAGQDSVSGLNYLGVYDSGTAYDKNDTVLATTAGNTTHTYVCIVATGCAAGGDPTTDTVNWAIIAFQGPTGLQGAQGVQGAQGEKGDPGILGIGANSDGVLVWDAVNGILSLTACQANYILKFDGADWNCAADGNTDTNTTYTLGWDDSTRTLTFTPNTGASVELVIPDDDTTYTAGDGLRLSGTEFSVDCASNATAFCQGGNSFGTDATIGTNDNFGLTFETNGASRASITPEGYFIVKNSSSNASTAFQVQNNGNLPELTVNTSNNKVYIGSATGDNIKVGLVLDSYNQTIDPIGGENGEMYYNSAMNKFRCFENGAWLDCISGNGYRAKLASVNTVSTGTNLDVSVDHLTFRLTKNGSTSGSNQTWLPYVVNNDSVSHSITYDLDHMYNDGGSTQSMGGHPTIAAGATSSRLDSDNIGLGYDWGTDFISRYEGYIEDDTTGVVYYWEAFLSVNNQTILSVVKRI
jgi:hypothetical protein